MTWWQLDDGHGALEFDEPALELHWLLVGQRSVAWWTDELGRYLGPAVVGEA